MDTQAETTTAAPTQAAAPANTAQVTVKLETPIRRGGSTIDVLYLRKPLAGALRGINLGELLTLRAEAVMRLLPRITTPTLVPQDVEQMDPVDLVACASEVVNFLVPAQQLEIAKVNQAKVMASLGE